MPAEAHDPEQRPSPDALLEAAQRETRGRLKIFLGAAPGVGKTYEMLREARARKAEGLDVVVAVAETHGRKETQALLRGLEVLPRRRVAYKGHVIEEMDLDALLARRPQLAVVDELAHTNAPGSRHPKRYQDVDELIHAGIDVYTTLNVQHLESLNDVIAQITRIRVRETLPDRVLDRADEIELVDLTPEALIKRLEEGKVYVREQAQRALRHYFSPGNLTALRELALRRAAQRVDQQMLGYMKAHAISGPWPAGERVLVCINEHRAGEALVRRARRLADSLKAGWVAVYVENPRHRLLSERDRDRIAQTLRLAQHLGGDVITLPGRSIAETLLAYARENNVTQIVIGKSRRSRWFEMIYGSVVHDLVRRSGPIAVQVVAGDPTEPAPTPTMRPPLLPKIGVRALVGTMAITGAALAISVLLDRFLDFEDVSMIFLVAVLASASAYGLAAGLSASMLAVVAYNFFFFHPVYTLRIADPANLLTLFVFLIAAIIASNLAARIRAQADMAATRARTAGELFSFSGKLAGVAHLDDILWAACYQIAAMLKAHVVVLVPEEGRSGLVVRAGYPPEDTLDTNELAAARWCWDHAQPAGRNSDTLPGASRLFLPMRTAARQVGVVGIARHDEAPFTPDERRLLDALIDQTALAVERARLVEEVEAAKLAGETERLLTAMMTSISHDLRTPLASILGAVSGLRRFGDDLDRSQRTDLATTIQEEAERLDRFVGNLLDMTRLEAGAVGVRLGPIEVGEVVDTGCARVEKLFSRHRVVRKIPPDLPCVRADYLLLEQCLVNLLDNAAKYAPAGTTITVAAAHHDDKVLLSVLDEGPGVPEDALLRIFEKFYRAESGDRRPAGTGLGLAIAKGFIEAMGGTILARNRTGGGASFTLAIPVEPHEVRPAKAVEPEPPEQENDTPAPQGTVDAGP